MSETFFVTMFRRSGHGEEPDRYFVNATTEGERPEVLISYDEAELLKQWSDTYNERHNRSYESSMSACIHYIFYNPAVAQVEGMKGLLELLTHEDGKVTPVHLSNVAGFATAFECKPEEGKKAYDEATPVELINEDFNELVLAKKRQELEDLELAMGR